MLKNKSSSIYKKNMFLHFLKDEQGVYSIIMGLISLLLIGFVALVVDGSGMLLDKARFNQGMEQAGLLLVAENNQFREQREHYDVTRQQVTSDEKAQFKGDQFKTQQDKRNKELIATLVGSYYLPNNYQQKNTKITDKFNYKCGHLEEGGVQLKSVACEVSGEFDRPSWLYMKQDGFNLSFDKTVKVKTEGIYVQKNLDTVANKAPPLDVMLVLDLSRSMDQNIYGGDPRKGQKSKIDMLRSVTQKVSEELLSKENSRYNRLGFTSFALGASQKDKPNYCYFPYAVKNGLGGLNPQTISDKDKEIKINYRDNRTSNFQNIFYHVLYHQKELYFDLKQTVKDIKHFDGKNNENWIYFEKKSSYASCLTQYKGGIDRNGKPEGPVKSPQPATTTHDWYNAGENSKFYNDFIQIHPNGGTLSSSGLLIGANYLVNKNTKDEVQPHKLGVNTKRVLLIMSDGKDEIPYNQCGGGDYDTWIFETIPTFESNNRCVNATKKSQDPGITTELINNGMCDAIRNRLDELQDPNYKKQQTKIAFVFFGPKKDAENFGTQMQAWKECVGQENLYFAENETKLLDSFRHIISSQEKEKGEEEVGHAATERPNFTPNK